MVVYEWVVERIDPDSEDILDCSYWPEDKRAEAQALANAWRDEGKVVDFGLSRGVWDEDDGLIARGYLYEGPSGWPDPLRFDDGSAVPKRFKLEA